MLTDPPSDPETLRATILDLVGRYHAAAHRRAPFDPEKPNVPVAGRVFDARDMRMLVDFGAGFLADDRSFQRRVRAQAGRAHRRETRAHGQLRVLGEFRRRSWRSPLLGSRRVNCGRAMKSSLAPPASRRRSIRSSRPTWCRCSSTWIFRPTTSRCRDRSGDHAAHPRHHDRPHARKPVRRRRYPRDLR